MLKLRALLEMISKVKCYRSALACVLFALPYMSMASTVATPTVSPAAGTYTSVQTVTISDSTSGAAIHYTTDGSTPTATSATYTSAITVSSSETIKAIGIKSGWTQSAVRSAAYTINLPATATPTSSPAAGTYTSIQTVTISDSTSVATIYYTTDGSTPTTSSSVYSSPITVGTSETVKAVATASGHFQSAVGSAAYTISLPVVATPTFSPAAGSYATSQTITINDSTSSATIYYTTDGSTPTTSSTVYSASVPLSYSAVVKAIAVASGYSQSPLGTSVYTINGSWMHIQGTSAANASKSTTSLTLTLPSDPVPGHEVLVGIEFDCCSSVPVSQVSVQDANGNWYLMSPRSPLVSPDSNNTASMYFFGLLNAPANASKTLHINWATAIDAVAWADEFSSSNGTASFDTEIGAIQTFAGNTINAPSITPAGSNELLYALAFPGNVVTAPTVGASGGSWIGATGGIDGTATGGAAEYNLSASGSTPPDFTDAVAGDTAGVAMLAISPQPGISPPAPSVCGNLSQLDTDDGNAQGQLGVPCVTGSNAGGYTVSSISYWVGSPTSTSLDLGVYADSSATPGALLCHASTGTITPTSGWNSVSISGCPTLSSGTRYWIGYITGSNQIQQGITPGVCPGTSLSSTWANNAESSVALTSPFGPSTPNSAWCYSMAMTLNPVALANTCGETAQSGTDSGNANQEIGTPCVTGGNAGGYTVSSISYWVGSPSVSNALDVGVFSDSSGSPGTLLCHASVGTTTPPAGWNSVGINGCPALSANTTYWVGYISGSSSMIQGIVSGTCPGTTRNSVYSNPLSGASLANPFGTATAVPACYSMYMTLGTGVMLPTPTLSVSSSLSPSSYGQAVSLTATISSGPTGLVNFYSDGVQIGQSPINGSTATLITSALPLGSHSITASWPGNGSYNPISSGAITQTISVGTPVITWASPAPLPYGQALSGTQLNATANLPGTFVYTPASGTVLPPGIQTLSTTFTPTDANDYSTATATVALNVSIAPSAGFIRTIVGSGYWGYSGDDGQAIDAQMEFPAGIALDSAGNIYIPDNGDNVVRKVSASTGVITTIAGTGTQGYSGDGGQATNAQLNSPFAVAVDAAGNVYVADSYNNRIRKIAVSTGVITTVSGTGTAGYSGDNGAATDAELSSPGGIAFDGAGNLYIADTQNGVVREVDASTEIIRTIAGSHTWGDSGDGGPATSAAIFAPVGITVDSTGNLYVTDAGDGTIREVAAQTGIISTVAGNRTLGYAGDNGPATNAELDYPYALAVDAVGNLYIADYGNFRIRMVSSATGIITTVAGNGTQGYSGDGGPATSAELSYPHGVAVDTVGNLYVGDTGNHVVRVVGSGQAGAPTFSPGGGTYSSAQSVNISDATSGVTIYFTTDGSTPTTASSVYGSPITISTSETVKAIATATGYSQSAVGSAGYTINVTPPAATPTFSPSAGTYSSTQTVAINDATSGAAIYYTTDGTTPTTSSSVYTGPITVSSSEIIQAIATATGYSQSAVGSASYTITSPATTPTFSPVAGTYSSTQTVTISDTTSGAVIYYTTNGTTPTTSSALYSGPISISSSETVEAIAIATGYSQSAIASASYTITSRAATPTFSPVAGTYTSTQTVTISDTTSGSTIYYTTDGSTPTTSSSTYSGPITVSSSETVDAIATAAGYSQSAVGSASYTITSPAATPTFSPAAGTYNSTQTVAISDTTPGATIYYTTDGSTPTTSSAQYTGPITVSSSEVVEAIATATGHTQSSVGSAAFTITSLVTTPTFSPAAGTYTSTQTVTISDATSGAVIYYTTDGTAPTSSSTQYTGPITVSSSETLEAIATDTGYSQSEVGSAAFTITSLVATPTFSPAAGTYTSTQTVMISDATSGSTIYYTTDGTAPTTSSTQYTGPIMVSSSETLEAIATATGYSQSEAGSAAYTITSGGTQTTSVSYTYDSLGRLSQAQYTTSSGTITVTYSYDSAGNRTGVVTQ